MFSIHWQSPVILLVLPIAVFSLHRLFSNSGRTLPGPRRFPLIGNVISTKRIWVSLAQFSRDHGILSILRKLKPCPEGQNRSNLLPQGSLEAHGGAKLCGCRTGTLGGSFRNVLVPPDPQNG